LSVWYQTANYWNKGTKKKCQFKVKYYKCTCVSHKCKQYIFFCFCFCIMKLICFCQKHKEICQVRENKDMKIPKKKTKTKKYVLFTFMGYTCTLVVFCFKLTFFFCTFISIICCLISYRPHKCKQYIFFCFCFFFWNFHIFVFSHLTYFFVFLAKTYQFHYTVKPV
jgi:hypothetical protein